MTITRASTPILTKAFQEMLSTSVKRHVATFHTALSQIVAVPSMGPLCSDLASSVYYRYRSKDGIIELALVAVLILLALTLHPASAARTSPVEAPHLWTLRILAGAGIVANTVLPHIFQGLRAPFQAELIANTMLLVVAVWNLTRWSYRRDWNQEHLLALASGTLGFFILIWAPILELRGGAGGNPTRGTIMWAAIYLIFLIILARRVARLVPSTKVAAI